jgi:hypothetical protein
MNFLSCALWTIKLSLKFFRINWSRIRPHFQKRKCSSQPTLHVCKSEKILQLGKYLFQGSKQSSMNQFLRDGLTLSYFEMSYHLKSWELDGPCPPNQLEMFVGHLGGIHVQVWVLMHLWQWSQYPYLISFQVFLENFLTVSTFRNLISSLIFGDGVCMSTGWKHNTPSPV